MPELTFEQKTQVLLHQRQQLTLQVTLQQLQKQYADMPRQLEIMLLRFCSDLDVNPSHYTFDLDTLTFIAKDPAPPPNV